MNPARDAHTPRAYLFAYSGPSLVDATPEAVAATVFGWFNANGGTDRPIIGAALPGVNLRLTDTLDSPSVDEWSVNASTQFAAGFLRVDYIHRDWKDFYGRSANLGLGTVTNALGQTFDLNLVENTNDGVRQYDALQMQGGYRLMNRFNLGGSYTWSELVGNVVGETAASGPVTVNSDAYYPEYLDVEHNNPVGFLPQDQTHKLRAWASADFPTAIGNFNVGVLERWDSGTPYSLLASINVAANANFYGAGQPGGVANPGYAQASTGAVQTYYFSDRGEFRFDDLWATDLAINYDTNPAWLRGVAAFAQAEVLNVFDSHATLSWDTNVLTQNSGAAGAGLVRFNPRAGDVPVEGVHYRLGPLFGRPTLATTPSTPGHYQLARTYRFSMGLRF